MDQKKIGSFLKELRKEKNITQEQLAEKLGVSGRTVSRWETGNNMPDISLLVEIAEMYDVSIPEIINGERKSEDMKEEVKEVAEKMADYAGVEKSKIVKDIQKQSIYGVIAIIGLVIIELFGLSTNKIAGTISLYLETLACVSVFMVFFMSTGLIYKINKKNKVSELPKPLLYILAAVCSFAIAALIANILKFFGI